MPKPTSHRTQARLEDPGNCICFNLRKAARAVTQAYDDIMRPSGLRSTQHSLLRVIQASETVSVSTLAERAVMDRTTLTRNLELLQREGLVLIRPGQDARVREVSLTKAGERKLAQALPYWEKAQSQMIGRLTPGRSDELLSHLTATLSAIQPPG